MLSPTLFCLFLGSLCGLIFVHNSVNLIPTINLLYIWLSIVIAIFIIVKTYKFYAKFFYKFIKYKKLVYYFLIFILSTFFAYSYTSIRSNLRLQHKLPSDFYNKVINVNIKIISLPSIIYAQNQQVKGLKFEAKIIGNKELNFQHLLVNSYANIVNLIVGDVINVDVKLKPPYSAQNPYLFDYEFYLFSNNIHALATIDELKAQKIQYLYHSNSIDTWIEQIRFFIQEKIKPYISNLDNKNILLALIIGNQAQISSKQWKLFNQSGIGHLISISGLHITMLAFISSFLPLIIIRFYPRILLYLNKRYICASFGLFCAGLYTLISGLQIPAQRTWIMLFFMFIFYKHFSIITTLVLSALCIIYFDPWCVGSASFWLSFLAVGILIFMGKIIIQRNSIKLKFWWVAISSQIGISIAMIPISILIFGQFSLISPLANAIAIPIVSYLVAPISLLASLLAFIPIFNIVTKYCFIFSDYMLHVVINFCAYLVTLPLAFNYIAKPNLLILILSFIGIVCILMPYTWRWFGILLCIPLFLHKNLENQLGKFSALFFDVGQGSSILISTANHHILFDTGPANFDNSNIVAEKTIIPILYRLGIKKLDSLIVSHPDKDHSAGLPLILNTVPINNLWVGMETTHNLLENIPAFQQNIKIKSCLPTTWEYDKVQFSILYPFANNDFSQKTNYNSCVLKVSSGSHSILLTADIEQPQEELLVNTYADLLSSDILLAPHHGSKTSSSVNFLQQVKPSNTIIQNGFLNMYKHPHQNILQRYNDISTKIWRTDIQGAIEVNMNTENYSIKAYRITNKHYWSTF